MFLILYNNFNAYNIYFLFFELVFSKNNDNIIVIIYKWNNNKVLLIYTSMLYTIKGFSFFFYIFNYYKIQ
jgi:hypothetical protein